MQKTAVINEEFPANHLRAITHLHIGLSTPSVLSYIIRDWT